MENSWKIGKKDAMIKVHYVFIFCGMDYECNLGLKI